MTFQQIKHTNDKWVIGWSKCQDLKKEIDSVIIYNITDKGISVGQTSSVNINNALIFNTGIGVAVKDSSWASVKNSTFYTNKVTKV